MMANFTIQRALDYDAQDAAVRVFEWLAEIMSLNQNEPCSREKLERSYP
jgi:hypothetical protein